MKTAVHSPYKYYSTLTVLFYLFLFVNNVMVYKVVQIFGIELSAASIVYPLTYQILDIVTEVYGYKFSKKIIWQSTIYNIFFAGLITLLLVLPSPPSWQMESAFSSVFKGIFPISILHGIAAPGSYFLNAYLLSKWKILYKGKHFWLRSIASTFIGELVFSIIMTTFTWYEFESFSALLILILVTYFTKFTWSILGAYPSTKLVRLISASEGINAYDHSINFNPFVR